ncbi:hypothetical protein AWW67_16140 [Roseivirga seohaensis]|uniref:Uncharacterized protein n=1 Tax=Roseivirga seohaensis TaxID=1914963 RepID=A0A150Y2H2_9BACT|nr:hypothetical protein [Roseivirga seohaensis]KYG85240.1 hypothetical protein AWW67_16140 [Roseivirga seohaensis]
MNSINNTIDILRRRIPLMICLLIGISSTSMASEIADEKLTREEAIELISEVKDDLNLGKDCELEFVIDDEGNVKPSPIKIIKIYDKDNELLLEAPIHTVEQMSNKELRRLVNSSDFLIASYNTFYYRLDL